MGWKDRVSADLAIVGQAATGLEWRAFEVRWTKELPAPGQLCGWNGIHEEIHNGHARVSAATVERIDQRALTLNQLWNLCSLLVARCASEVWCDPFPTIADRNNVSFGQPLKPEDVTFYHLHYFVTLPTSVVGGVWLTCPGFGTPFNKGTKVTQSNNPFPFHGTAEGSVVDVEKCSGHIKALLKVTKGCFTHMAQSNSIAECGENVVAIEGIKYARPACVDMSENSSYMEQVSDGPQLANWFCSHAWGEPVLDFVQCCQAHADLRCCGMDAAPYWIAAYATRQRDICKGIDSNLDTVASNEVLRNAKGILMILNEVATPFSRMWCCHDVHCAISGNGHGKIFDAVRLHDCKVHLQSLQPINTTDHSSFRVGSAS